MELTAELQPPLLRLNLGGVVFKKGVPQSVDLAMAKRLFANPRFKVKGLNNRAAIEAEAFASRPQGDLLLAAIREAANGLNVDDDANFDRHGKPSHLAISEKLSYAITPQERDRALGMTNADIKTVAGTLDMADGRVEKQGEGPTDRRSIAIRRGVVVAPVAPVERLVDPTTKGSITA